MSLIPILSIIFIIIPTINSVYRQDSASFFEPFIINDLFSIYNKQLSSKICSLKDGPSCFHLSHYSPLPELIPQVKAPLQFTNIFTSIKNHISSFRKVYDNKLNQVYKFTSKIVRNLLVTFESYDEITKNGNDIYAPPEKIIPFNVGELKLVILGRLRLTNRNEIPIKIDPNNSFPDKTYGIVESKEVIIKVENIFVLNSFFIRCSERIAERQVIEFIVKGMKEGKEIFVIQQSIVCSRSWNKIQAFSSLPVEYVSFPGGFEIDNLYWTYDNEFNKKDDDDRNDQEWTKIINQAVNKALIKDKINMDL